MDKYPHHSEFMPLWKRIDHNNPPKNRKMLFKSSHGAAVIGVYYPESGWDWYCGLPKHTEADKRWIKAQSSASGRFNDGKPYRQED